MMKEFIKMVITVNLVALFPVFFGFIQSDEYIKTGFYFIGGICILVANLIMLAYGRWFYVCWKEENRVLNENEVFYQKMKNLSKR